MDGGKNMERNNAGLGSLLNEVSVSADGMLREEKIIYIDIDKLESNPRNFYGLRDIDSLATLISVSHLIEPLRC